MGQRTYPAPTGTPTPVGNNVVFRVSFPGTSIPNGWTTPAQNPVLVLQPGFQMTVDYQSPNGTMVSYSFLQGNSQSRQPTPSTWISASNPANPGLSVTTSWSVYGRNPSPSPTPATTPFPTILLTSPSPTAAPATLWAVTTLAEAPMFAKADPRSMRYNSQVGVLHLASPPHGVANGVAFHRWHHSVALAKRLPSAAGNDGRSVSCSYATVTPTPTVTPAPNYNPALYALIPYPSDNAAATATIHIVRLTASPRTQSWRPVMMNRPFRSVGEMAYAFRDQPFRTLSFSSSNSPDAGLLDLFTVNDYTDSSGTRGGLVSLNSRQGPAACCCTKHESGVRTHHAIRADRPLVDPSPSPR